MASLLIAAQLYFSPDEVPFLATVLRKTLPPSLPSSEMTLLSLANGDVYSGVTDLESFPGLLGLVDTEAFFFLRFSDALLALRGRWPSSTSIKGVEPREELIDGRRTLLLLRLRSFSTNG